MKSLFPAIVALLITFVPTAKAVEIPGHDSPAFQAALQDWLDGNDMAALTQLGELARQDNRAAQIFLARVAEEAYFHSHVTGSLPRAERVALLRQRGGLSGKSWLKAAQEDVPLALAILQSKNVKEKGAATPVLLKYGETTLTLRLANAILQRGQFSEARQILRQMDISLGAVKVLMYMAVNGGAMGLPMFGPKTERMKHRVDPITGIGFVDQLGAVGVTPRVFFEDERYRDLVVSEVVKVSELLPVINWCNINCADSVPQCTVAALFGGIHSYGPFSSPSESLLPNVTYWSSPRIEADVARRLPDLTDYGPWLRGYNTCFVDKMTALQSRVR